MKDDKSVIREGSRDWKERVGVQKGAGANSAGVDVFCICKRDAVVWAGMCERNSPIDR